MWKLDRLGRSLRHLVDTVPGLAEPPPPAGKLVLHVFAALAEFESDHIRERTTAGLPAARPGVAISAGRRS